MSALDSLGDYCGIVSSYQDARGELRVTSPETKRALLFAMGHDSADESSALQALESLQAAEIERGLPPVYVHYQTGHPFSIVVKGKQPAAVRAWRIELEDGGIKQSQVDVQRNLMIPGDLPLGYHTLALEGSDSHCLLIVTPGKCWVPEGIETGRKLWGMATQLYLLRSEANWGIGDYSDLKQLVQTLALSGADMLGLNPLHAMFPDVPERASPYSPASRLLLNGLNIDVARVVESLDCWSARTTMNSASFKEKLAHARAASLLDYTSVTELKFPLLHEIFWCCDRRAAAWKSFLTFRSNAGAAFEQHCLFLALRFHFASQSPEMGDWQHWPEEYRLSDSAATIAFGQVYEEAVTFQAWVQFIADQQLRDCCVAANAMAVGLYRDLAVGAAAGGAETWANPRAICGTIHVGAPPDIHNPQGQDWGLPPFNPQALRAEGYRGFIELLRANMRHAGALRIDHVMALQQLYWLPTGHSPADGAYVRYPLKDLVGVLALESHRQKCMVVGEDLGTVPDGFRERMDQARVLSYRVLFFEKSDDRFIAPEEYPLLSLAVAGSHDLPTLRAWWESKDLELKQTLHLYPKDLQAKEAKEERIADRSAMSALLYERGYLTRTDPIDAESFAQTAHRLLARTCSAITMLQLDDVIGEVNPVNVPTTTDEHPNWRRRHSVSIDELRSDSRFLTTIAMIRNERRSV